MSRVYCDCGNLLMDDGALCVRCEAEVWCDSREPWWLRALRWLVR